MKSRLPIMLLLFTSACAIQQKNYPPTTSSEQKVQVNQPYKYREVDSRTPKIKPTVDAEVASPSKTIPTPEAESSVNVATSQIAPLIPAKVHDKQGWADDIYWSFKSHKIPLVKNNLCAVIAVIDQESQFQAEPEVEGLPKIVLKELKQRREKYNVPEFLLNKGLSIESPNGKTYFQRIMSLKTENDINRLYDDFINQVPLGKVLFDDYNPVHTGGPMQVSLSFAKESISNKPYPVKIEKNLRVELFSRRGGIYFGVEHLLGYSAKYHDMIYRFADFNAGNYASRNAAFQEIVSKISHKHITLDGDLLTYDKNNNGFYTGEFTKASLILGKKLNMSPDEIHHDLLLEKTEQFETTNFYQKVLAIAKKNKLKISYARMPKINLSSPKISRKLTTEWFANRVNSRYELCMRQQLQTD